ncbi:MAG: hypothetical protein ACC642_09680 [Pseudomonadales bacterium]
MNRRSCGCCGDMGLCGTYRVVWVLPVALLLSGTAVAGSVDWSGYVSLEPRIFFEAPLFPEQNDNRLSPSAVLAPEFRIEWQQGAQRLTISPYLRYDADDSNRTHADFREFLWQYLNGSWSVQAGLGKVFWGVTESRHLVDIINQVDQVEDYDEEDRLGQPMIAVERWTNFGVFTAFLLPGFRERTFPAADARLRGPLPVDTDRAEYQSGAKQSRLDLAFRWSNVIGDWDLGVSGFHGTSREPRFLLRGDMSGDGLVLIPRYDVIDQIGVDLQYTKGAWLWKLEAIGRQGSGKTFGASVAGFEYTFYALGDSGTDLGVLLEYLYDGRDETAPPTIYNDGWFAGFRLGLNDFEDTAILAGAIVEDNGTFAIVEAERRLGEAWKFEAELRWLINVDPQDLYLGGFRNDSFITLRVARYL